MKKESIRKESGRSMLEMVVVITIIILLTMGALVGYQQVISHHEANTIYQDVLTQADSQRGKNFRDKMIYDSKIGNATRLGNPINTDNSDTETFTVTVKSISSELCSSLKKKNWYDAQNIKLNEFIFTPDTIDCDTIKDLAAFDLGVVFPKAVRTANTGEKSSSSSSCSNHATCTNGNIVCGKGYYLDDNTCPECAKNGSTTCPTCEALDETKPYWNGSDCICNESSCGTGKYCNAGSCADCATPTQNCNITSTVIDPNTGCTTEVPLSCSGSTPVCGSSNTCICPTNATCAEGNIVCTNTDEALITVNVSDKEYKICCPQGKTSTNGTSCNTDCTSGTVCTSCPSETPYWGGSDQGCSINRCSNYAETSPTGMGGYAATAIFGTESIMCYCTTEGKKWTGTDCSETLPTNCSSNSDCTKGQYCLFASYTYNVRDTASAMAGETGSCQAVGGHATSSWTLTDENNNKITHTVWKSTEAGLGSNGKMNWWSAKNWCLAQNKDLIKIGDNQLQCYNGTGTPFSYPSTENYCYNVTGKTAFSVPMTQMRTDLGKVDMLWTDTDYSDNFVYGVYLSSGQVGRTQTRNYKTYKALCE